ncbi:anti-sigma factor [Planococcus sp. ISL-110]|uniref:anti-sigma factor n=1 Tax=Planococcus sp. ISL-110 TaxID=2819167 RepID=UPI001BE5CB9B|nr:anti-sigma factor [Planococcus sp. ISL-110]MBT2572164.1 anti-sigma factor [Planococcus sp. ISL-110]
MTNVDCDRLVDYLNGTLSEDEIEQFEEHVKTCTECQEIVEATGELPYLADPVEPPADMKARILSNVFEEKPEQNNPPAALNPAMSPIPLHRKKSKPNIWRPLIAAVLLASLLGNAYAFLQLSDQDDAPETAIESIELQPSEAFAGTATAEMIQEEGSLNLVVQANQLAELDAGQVYQVWLIKDDQPIPAGAFSPNPNGEGASYYQLEENLSEWDTIAITLEPETGNELPEGEIVMSAGI